MHEASCRDERQRVDEETLPTPHVCRWGSYHFDDAAAAEGPPLPPMSDAQMKSVIAQIHSGKKAHEVKVPDAEETESLAQDAEETEPAAKDVEETADISADEGTAPSAAGHSWDPPAAQTAQMPMKKRRKRKTIEELMKENADVTMVNCSVREHSDEDNAAGPKQKRKNKKRAADEAAAEAARKAARKAAAVVAFGPSRPAAQAAENGDDIDQVKDILKITAQTPLPPCPRHR